jgi:hypothetical protein
MKKTYNVVYEVCSEREKREREKRERKEREKFFAFFHKTWLNIMQLDSHPFHASQLRLYSQHFIVFVTCE